MRAAHWMACFHCSKPKFSLKLQKAFQKSKWQQLHRTLNHSEILIATGKFSANGTTRVLMKLSSVQRNTWVEIRKLEKVLHRGVIGHLEIYQCAVNDHSGLTIVANVAVATGPALFGAWRSFVWNLFFIAYKGGYQNFRCPGQTQKGGSIFYTCYTETLFDISELNFSKCLGNCFCMKVHFKL